MPSLSWRYAFCAQKTPVIVRFPNAAHNGLSVAAFEDKPKRNKVKYQCRGAPVKLSSMFMMLQGYKKYRHASWRTERRSAVLPGR